MLFVWHCDFACDGQIPRTNENELSIWTRNRKFPRRLLIRSVIDASSTVYRKKLFYNSNLKANDVSLSIADFNQTLTFPRKNCGLKKSPRICILVDHCASSRDRLKINRDPASSHLYRYAFSSICIYIAHPELKVLTLKHSKSPLTHTRHMDMQTPMTDAAKNFYLSEFKILRDLVTSFI